MRSDFLPPANDTAAPFEVTDARITVTAIILGALVLVMIYPAYALLRYWWGYDAFSWSSTLIALVCAVLFGLNVRRRVRSLARAGTPQD